MSELYDSLIASLERERWLRERNDVLRAQVESLRSLLEENTKALAMANLYSAPFTQHEQGDPVNKIALRGTEKAVKNETGR